MSNALKLSTKKKPAESRQSMLYRATAPLVPALRARLQAAYPPPAARMLPPDVTMPAFNDYLERLYDKKLAENKAKREAAEREQSELLGLTPEAVNSAFDAGADRYEALRKKR